MRAERARLGLLEAITLRREQHAMRPRARSQGDLGGFDCSHGDVRADQHAPSPPPYGVSSTLKCLPKPCCASARDAR